MVTKNIFINWKRITLWFLRIKYKFQILCVYINNDLLRTLSITVKILAHPGHVVAEGLKYYLRGILPIMKLKGNENKGFLNQWKKKEIGWAVQLLLITYVSWNDQFSAIYPLLSVNLSPNCRRSLSHSVNVSFS